MDLVARANFVEETEWRTVEKVDYSPAESAKAPKLPTNDNISGAPEKLLAANRHWREHFWPSPFDRTDHVIKAGDARNLAFVKDRSVHLIVTSPPYFNLKPYNSDCNGSQLGRIASYENFLAELDTVWRECHRVLVPGGRVCCVIGDILVPRKTDGRHRILPLPADIMVRSRDIGFDTLTPILWFKIGNRTNEAGGGSSGYYGKPYQPGAIIKNDFEHILMLRKPGAYRQTTMLQKSLSMLQRDEMDLWQRPFWSDIRGASLRNGHPAPYPVELAERLIRMYSFAGDVVLDPFGGSGSTAAAAVRTGRSSILVDIEESYVDLAARKVVIELKQARTTGPSIQTAYFG
ncbi:MAG TPA: site-specific DNA-methyltransferase [Xanthobacteraceae bacterium]|nr:site-specific DNA-methyltransferase [Xanthobacteraceae bacterium]